MKKWTKNHNEMTTTTKKKNSRRTGDKGLVCTRRRQKASSRRWCLDRYSQFINLFSPTTPVANFPSNSWLHGGRACPLHPLTTARLGTGTGWQALPWADQTGGIRWYSLPARTPIALPLSWLQVKESFSPQTLRLHVHRGCPASTVGFYPGREVEGLQFSAEVPAPSDRKRPTHRLDNWFSSYFMLKSPELWSLAPEILI